MVWRPNLLWVITEAILLSWSRALSFNYENTQQSGINIPIRVLWENDQMLAINKPHGISHHNDESELGILNLVRRQQEVGLLPYKGRLYGVHRLDRVTSGILLLAKNAETASALTQAFRESRVVKYYTGISLCKATKKQGIVQGNMVRGRRKSWYLERGTGENFAKTRFYTSGLGLLQTHARTHLRPKTLMVFRPYTGRTHQLRVAGKAVGLPLAGDPIYRDGSEKSGDIVRTCLHATGLYIPADDKLDEIALWCMPEFGFFWNKDGRIEFNAILLNALQKHCDCKRMLDNVPDL